MHLQSKDMLYIDWELLQLFPLILLVEGNEKMTNLHVYAEEALNLA